MKIYGLDFPRIAMKFCEKKEYAEDVANGNIYMKESGYFRKLEDTFRGDKFDGKRPLDVIGESATIESSDGDKIEFSHNDFMVEGFVKDDKMPIFCATLLNENIIELIEKASNNELKFKFKKEFIGEASKFGKYIAFFNIDVFINKMDYYLKSNNIAAKVGAVQYTDISKEYDPNIEITNSNQQYEVFFKKDNLYQWQNEWRVVLIKNDHTLISDNKDFYIMKLGKLDDTGIMSISFISEEITLSNYDSDM